MSEPQPCDECGTMLESGFEPNSLCDDHLAWEAGETEIGVDWFERALEPEA